MTHRTRIAATVVVLALFAVALGVCFHHGAAPEMPSVLRYSSGDLRYTYFVPTGAENLFDVSTDPKMLKDLGGERPGDLRRLREELRKKIGVESLDKLRDAQRDVIDRLRGLGYF